MERYLWQDKTTLLSDHLGSPRMISDSLGQVVKAIWSDAYGDAI
ncbi:hypothetical protein [Marinobacter nauticus]|nr:hypothetical protein [Marinobacter nauticus]